MRKIAIYTALMAILSAGTSFAGDFDALLGELNFGVSTEDASQSVSLNSIAAAELAPAPAMQVSAQQPVGDAPLPTPEPVAAPEPQSLTDPGAVAQPAPAPQPMHVAPYTGQTCDSGACTSCNTCSSGRCNARGCRGLFESHHGCVPHTPPNLPTSTFYQYFKSNSCNTRVWDGFQNRCYGNKHSTGQCNCFEPRQKLGCGLGCLSRGVHRASCLGGCESGDCDSGCHELPAGWGVESCDGEATCGAAPACDTACDAPCCDG